MNFVILKGNVKMMKNQDMESVAVLKALLEDFVKNVRSKITNGLIVK